MNGLKLLINCLAVIPCLVPDVVWVSQEPRPRPLFPGVGNRGILAGILQPLLDLGSGRESRPRGPVSELIGIGLEGALVGL